MISTFKHKKITWLDLESPTADEVKSVMQKYSIHPLVAEELLRPTLKPKIDAYKDIIYLILHFPIFSHTQKEYMNVEIDFIIGKNFLITAHYNTIPTLIEMAKVFEADSMLGENNLTKHTGTLFFYIIRQLYNFSTSQIDHIQNRIFEIEDKMFDKTKGSQYKLVRQISHVRIDILNFRRIIHPHKEVFTSLEHQGGKFLGPDFPLYLSNMIGEYYKLWNTVGSFRETIKSLQETTDSLLSHRSNEIMKVLTVMAFITFPLMLVTSMFGMNTKILPIAGMPGDFWIIMGLMAIATIGFFYFFKRKKWL